MSEADQKRVEKEVTIVAYSLDEDTETPIRQWAEKVTGIDCTSYEMVTEKEYELEIGPEGGYNFSTSLNPYGSKKEDVEKAKRELEKSGVENVRIKVESHREKKWEHSPNWAASQFTELLFNLLPGELEGSMTRHNLGTRWNDEQDRWGVRMWSSDFTDMRVLSKEEKREDDDLYETMAERPCFSFTVKMKAPDESYIDTWTDQVVTECVKHLSRHPHIGKVRFMDCVTVTSQEGECYSL